MKPTTSEWCAPKRSKIHLQGVFATKDIPKGTRIIEYVGRKLTKKQSDDVFEEQFEKSENHTKDGGVYLFELNKRYDIDGNVSWNTARLINHGCDPNAETDIIRGHIYIIATRDIKKGEEILYNYGFDIDNYEDHPCLCGSPKCMGYIVDEDLWPKLKRKLAAKKRKKKA